MVYFAANDGVNGEELWKSDGTSTGTTLVKDILPGSRDSFPDNLTNVGGTLYFTASDGVHGKELWQSDGTSTGTTMVMDILPGGSSSYPRYLTNVGGKLYFAADDGVHGVEPWIVRPESPPALIGDANGDGQVGAADYAIWAATFGEVGQGLAADFDGNGEVGLGDYALWAANFGNSISGGAGGAAKAALSSTAAAAIPRALASRVTWASTQAAAPATHSGNTPGRAHDAASTVLAQRRASATLAQAARATAQVLADYLHDLAPAAASKQAARPAASSTKAARHLASATDQLLRTLER